MHVPKFEFSSHFLRMYNITPKALFLTFCILSCFLPSTSKMLWSICIVKLIIRNSEDENGKASNVQPETKKATTHA